MRQAFLVIEGADKFPDSVQHDRGPDTVFWLFLSGRMVGGTIGFREGGCGRRRQSICLTDFLLNSIAALNVAET